MSVEHTSGVGWCGPEALPTGVANGWPARRLTLHLELTDLTVLLHECEVLRLAGADRRFVDRRYLTVGIRDLIGTDLVITRNIHTATMGFAARARTITMTEAAFREPRVIKEIAIYSGDPFAKINLLLQHTGLFYTGALLTTSVICGTEANESEER